MRHAALVPLVYIWAHSVRCEEKTCAAIRVLLADFETIIIQANTQKHFCLHNTKSATQFEERPAMYIPTQIEWGPLHWDLYWICARACRSVQPRASTRGEAGAVRTVRQDPPGEGRTRHNSAGTRGSNIPTHPHTHTHTVTHAHTHMHTNTHIHTHTTHIITPPHTHTHNIHTTHMCSLTHLGTGHLYINTGLRCSRLKTILKPVSPHLHFSLISLHLSPFSPSPLLLSPSPSLSLHLSISLALSLSLLLFCVVSVCLQLYDPADIQTVLRADGRLPWRPPIPIMVQAHRRDGLDLGLGST